jgi:hypothetical protein
VRGLFLNPKKDTKTGVRQLSKAEKNGSTKPATTNKKNVRNLKQLVA